MQTRKIVRKTLLAKFFISAIIPISILLILFYAVVYFIESGRSVEREMADVRQELEARASLLSFSIWNFDLQQASLLLERSLESPRIKGLRIDFLIEPGMDVPRAYGASTPEPGEQMLTIPLNVKLPDNSIQAIGTLTAIVTTEGHYRTLRLALLRNIVFGLFLILILSAGIAYALRHTVLAPLHAIKDSLDHFKQTNHRTPVAWHANDELAEFIDAYNASLAHEEGLEDDLRQARDTADAANRAKSIFLANMSHELRTPLNAILGFSDILRRDPAIGETQQQTLAIIHKSGDHLLGLINDVLDLAKIEAGRMTLEPAPFDLGGMLLDITAMLRLRAQEKGLQLTVDESSGFPRYIVGDEAKLRQIFINLISNAIKATVQGGVTLRLGLKHNHAEHLLIEVEDTGCGISAEDQASLFQPFVQVGAQNKQQGTGLGLAITKQIVELMGGSLTLASTLGQGSTFRIDLPTQLANPDEISQPPKARGEVTGLEPGQPLFRVLVVDDQEDNCLLLERLLGNVGFDVQVARNGVEAVAQFQNWQPQFIWMDRRMPVMDGMEATRRIRALPDGDQVRIVAVTASTFREEDEQLITAGFDDIVHKPFRSEQIFDCMEKLLGVRFTRAEAETEMTPVDELSAEAMAALPEPLRQKLAQVLITLDIERIMEVIDTIGQTAPELAAALRMRVEIFDFPAILTLLGKDSPLG